MTKHYQDTLLAFLLAQLLMTSVMVYFYQKKKKIKYFQALGTYLKAEIGYFIVGFIAIVCVLFMLSDIIDLSLTKQDLRNIKDRNWKQNLQLYFKTSAFVLSCFIQYIVFTFKNKGKKAIDKVSDKILDKL